EAGSGIVGSGSGDQSVVVFQKRFESSMVGASGTQPYCSGNLAPRCQMIETIAETMHLVALMFLHQKLSEPPDRAGKADKVLQRGHGGGYGRGNFGVSAVEERAPEFETALDKLKQVAAVDLGAEVLKPGRGSPSGVEYIGAKIDDEMRGGRRFGGRRHAAPGFVLLEHFPSDCLLRKNVISRDKRRRTLGIVEVP